MRRLAGVGRAVSRILVPRRTASSLPAGPLPTPLLDRLKQPQPQRTHACGDLRISDGTNTLVCSVYRGEAEVRPVAEELCVGYSRGNVLCHSH